MWTIMGVKRVACHIVGSLLILWRDCSSRQSLTDKHNIKINCRLPSVLYETNDLYFNICDRVS